MKLEFYKLPFKSNFYDNWVYDADDNFIFQFNESKYKTLVLVALNGNERQHLDGFVLTVDGRDPNVILNKGEPFIIMRDPSSIMEEFLTLEQAKDIQYDLRDWIIHKLTN